MSNVKRTVGNFFDNPDLRIFFKAFNQLDSSTPIPNRVLPIAFNLNGEECTLFIVGAAVKAFEYIIQLAQKQAVAREKEGKEDRAIEFYCTGYIDNNNDIIIDHIGIPGIYYFPGKQKHTVDLRKFFFSKLPKDIHTEVTSNIYEYLQNFNTNDLKYAKKAVAMYGTTKPASKTGNERYCPTLGNIAHAVVPGQVTFDGPIASGVLVLTPQTISRNHTNSKIELDKPIIEAVLIDYKQNPTGYAYPQELHNITNCQIEVRDGELDYYPISASPQDTRGLPQKLKFIDIQRTK